MSDHPTYQGQPVTGVELAITGHADYPTGDPEINEEREVLVVGQFVRVQHKSTEGGIVRTHTFKVREAYVLEPGEASVLLTEAREKLQAELDRLLGRQGLPFADPDTGELP